MKKIIVTALVLGVLFYGCGSNESKTSASGNSAFKEKVAEKLGLSVFELENGVGPVKEKLNLTDQIDQIKAKSGEEVFTQKCTQCHKLDERYTGPPLRDVTTRRTPEYIMNMILNPQEMTQKHPEAKKLLAQYANQMTFQNVTEEDARNLLEYLRSVSK